MPEMLTRKDAARKMGISEDTLDQLRRDGQIAYVQRVPNGKVWIPESAIAEYIARITHPALPIRTVKETYRKRRI